ncbi:MAG: SDR family oxidoreductase [Myxococcota bacterium]|nr:SDR family oxidoreductase [Myxococcota bacterium]MDW8363922.1 SDR family oxidoreductase [Myxococcales bacterium]
MIFVTGATGYLGSYAIASLLRESDARLALLVRARTAAEAEAKLWRAMQLHLDPSGFRRLLGRVQWVHGDLTLPGLGLDPERRRALAGEVESVLHVAASLNRRSERACLNVNLRGTLSVVRFAMEVAERGRLRRFTHVSTVAVAGRRDREHVREDEAVDWERGDYDPYARTKKFAEHMARELLPPGTTLVLRPSIVMGDSRRPETTQFDMVRAFCVLADLPVLPMRSDARLDIVPADFVGEAIARLHLATRPAHGIYHLSAGADAESAGAIAGAMAQGLGRRPPRFVPGLGPAFDRLVRAAAVWPRRDAVQRLGALLSVFWPYITFDTVFDNARVRAETGLRPAPFTSYCVPLYRWATTHRFRYPYAELPPAVATAAVQVHA